MKNIYQLIKLHRRAQRRSSGSLHALTKEKSKNPPAKPWKGITGPNIKFHRARLGICAQVVNFLNKEFLNRRIGLSPARPPRVKNVPFAPIACPALVTTQATSQDGMSTR